MSDFKKDIEDIERDNHYKSIADKIRQTLSRIRQDPASSAKRWVWELVQNAKDTPNKWGKVSVEIELMADRRLLFKHNGDPFTLKNVMGLIEQVSSKDSMNEDGQTGKFGTGFICTHLLSDIIQIKGIVIDKNGDYRKFNLNLDRSGDSSEELIPRIKDTSRQFKNLGADSVINNYESNRKEDSFDTIFLYNLTTDEKLSAAEKGIEDLVNTLPITLITQREKIKQVRVINHVSNTDVLYVCETTPVDENVILSTIAINENKKYYLSFFDSAVSLTTEVADNESYCLVKRNSSHPVLYRDFPLIGSEKFYFPYILNGNNFFPTEKRDGLALNTADSSEACTNRDIVSHAVDAVISFNQWLIQRNALCRYNMAESQKPKPPIDYDETVAEPWIRNLQNSWRARLLEQCLAETDDGDPKPLKEYRIPWFKESKAIREQFYDIVKLCWLGAGVLPKREHLNEWIDVIRPQFESWNCSTLKYEIEDLLNDIQKQSNLDSLEHRSGKSREELTDWLNQLYAFIKENEMVGMLKEYAVIPNQRGDFKIIDELKTDYHSRIPEVLKEIYNSIVEDGNEVEVGLVEEAVNCEFFGNEISIYGQREIVEDLNNNREIVSYEVLSLYSEDAAEKDRQRREELYSLCGSYHQMRQFSSVAIDKGIDLWREAEDYWFEESPKLIVSYGTINRMSSEFFIEPISLENCLQWLDKYIAFYRANGKSDIVEKYDVFPNQKNVLCNISNLHFDKDIEEEYKDLDEVVIKGLEAKSWRDRLLSKTISGYDSHDPITIKDVYEDVYEGYKAGAEEKKNEIAAFILSLMPEDKDDKDEYRRLYDFVSRAIPTLPEIKKVTVSSGFDWTFAQEYFIEKVCRNVAETVSISGLLNSPYNFADKEDAINWVDSIIEFLHSFRSKKFWRVITDKDDGIGIWINQNEDFCRFQDVHKDDNINEDLKDLALNKYVNKDFREELFHTDSFCETFLETLPLSNNDVSKVIDDAIKKFDEDGHNKQDPEFAKLIFSLNKLNNETPNLELPYFTQKKASLIVGSLGEGETMNIVGDLIQKGDGYLQLINRLSLVTSERTLQYIIGVLEKTQGEDINPDEKDISEERKREIGDMGECYVYEELCSRFGKENVFWQNLATEETKDRDAHFNGKSYPLRTTSHDYDFYVKDDNRELFLEAKTTVGSIQQSSLFGLIFQTKEWRMADLYSKEGNYYVVRVFDVEGSPVAYYMNIKKNVY